MKGSMMNLTEEQAAAAAMAVGYSMNEADNFPLELQDQLVELDAYLQKHVYPRGRDDSLKLLESTFVELMKVVCDGQSES